MKSPCHQPSHLERESRFQGREIRQRLLWSEESGRVLFLLVRDDDLPCSGPVGQCNAPWTNRAQPHACRKRLFELRVRGRALRLPGQAEVQARNAFVRRLLRFVQSM